MSGHHHQDLMHGFHFLPVEYVHQMFLIRSVYLLCQIWKVKVIQFWWFEIKLASKKIAVMEEGVSSINLILIPGIDLFGQYHVETLH